MILQKNYVYVWCGNFHTDLRFRPKCIPFLNINFLLYFNFLVHRTLSIKIFSFQKFILQCKYFRHNNTVECSLRIQLPLLAPWVFSQERDLRFGPCISDKSTSTVSNFWVELGNSRKYPYPTTDGFHFLTPPCLRKFQNALPPHTLRIP